MGIKMVSKTLRMKEGFWEFVGESASSFGVSDNAYLNMLVAKEMGVELRGKVGKDEDGPKVQLIKSKEQIEKENPDINHLPDEVIKKLEDMGVKKGIEPKDGYKPISKGDSLQWKKVRKQSKIK